MQGTVLALLDVDTKESNSIGRRLGESCETLKSLPLSHLLESLRVLPLLYDSPVKKKKREKGPCKCKSQRAENTLNDWVWGSARSQEDTHLNSRN